MRCVKTFCGENVMISVIQDSQNPIIDYAISHFLSKYGIEYNDPELKFIYGDNKVDSKFVIRVIKNQIRNKIIGNIIIDRDKIPLFEKPATVEAKALAWFSDKSSDSEKYKCAAICDNNEIVIGFDILNEIGNILSGHLEALWPQKTREIQAVAKIPVVDAYEKFLFDCIMTASDISNIKISYKSFWPEGKEFAVCLTHDVDVVNKNYQYGTHFLKNLIKGRFGDAAYQMRSAFFRRKYPNPYLSFEKIMELEAGFGLFSTFFLLNGKGYRTERGITAFLERLRSYNLDDPRISEEIKRLNREGWEIGLHGRYSREKMRESLKEGQIVLENTVKSEIHGIRQHYLKFQLPELWQLMDNVGFKYDSSIGFRDKAGFRFGTCFPFYPFDLGLKKRYNVMEIPLIIMDSTVLSKRNCWEECKNLIDTVKKYKGVLTIDWHQRVFNEKEFPGWKKTYINIINYCLKENAYIGPTGSVFKWWENRWSN
jgi:peptidoglycan/xylan/chitin deacetylase (PgdA/CDA1 family)